ncbi:MAG: diguanylate cyclase [Xenococcaceae cyanobacterium MO_167.B27]|nr:diguanylate cyclase [Xenococcaceae cyanobacterium MO_167.B27]
MTTVRILLIEDSLTDALLLKKYFENLETNKFDLIQAKLISEGLKYLQQKEFDVVLLDLSLPDSSGLDSIRQIQNLVAEIPIIVLTGMEREELALQALREGAQDYIFKGQLFGSLLLRSINYSIERKQISEKLRQSEARYRGIVEDQTELVCRFLPDGTLTFVNQAYCRYFQQDSQDLLGENFKADLTDDNITAVEADLSTLSYQVPTKIVEYKLKLPDEQVCWQQWSYRALFQNKSLIEYQAVGRDITQRKKAEELLAQEAQRNLVLAHITQHIHQSLDLNIILETAVKEINQLLHGERIIIARIENSQISDILFESVKRGTKIGCDSENSISKIKKHLSQLLASKNILLEAISSNISNAVLSEINSHNCSVLFVPIIVEETIWGLIYLEKCSYEIVWKNPEKELLRQISLQLAIAIKQAELYHKLECANQELEKLAVIDGLTGIANRRKFDEYIQSEWLRLAREKSPLSLILCDIDHFKLYNDTYGHQAGDRCLRKVALAIKKVIKRPADLAARYGGEELAVILPNTTPEGAKKLAHQIGLQIQALQIPHICSPVDLYVTLSLGVAGCIPHHSDSPQALIAAADSNLYKAKNLGRNRVVGDC